MLENSLLTYGIIFSIIIIQMQLNLKKKMFFNKFSRNKLKTRMNQPQIATMKKIKNCQKKNSENIWFVEQPKNQRLGPIRRPSLIEILSIVYDMQTIHQNYSVMQEQQKMLTMDHKEKHRLI